jgi:hypothetical protein
MSGLENAHLAFDGMNKIKKRAGECYDNICPNDIDAFFTMGDNMYPLDDELPTDEELNSMLGLFKKDSLSSLPIYPVRGNHDCYFKDKNTLLNLSKKDP